MKTPPLYEQAKLQDDFNFKDHMKEINEYFDTLEVGERVVDTSKSAMYKKQGTIYMNDDNVQCVLWDIDADGCQMGTSITGGSRRLSDLKEIGFEL